jgi:hypothetical protein
MADLTPVPLRAGRLAYYNTTFNGLIPCKVLELRERKARGGWEAVIKLTATRKAYKRGEVLTVPADEVPPRDVRCVYQSNYHIRVRNCWHVEHEGQRHEVFASAVA